MLRPDPKNRPPTAQTANPDESREDPWMGRARSAYQSSTSYVDTNFRKQWEDSIRAFNGLHPTDSKYNSPAFAKRSALYRPKTRSVIRKNEAAAAAAFFSNMDVVSITADDESNKAQLVSAEVMKALLQYRLKKSIPWFLFVMGSIQDAQVVGTPCAHIYWDHRVRASDAPAPVEAEPADEDPENPRQNDLPAGAFTLGGGQEEAPQLTAPVGPELPKPYVDKPVMDLVPIENMRIDPSANWMDPINSSPYVIHLIPMYVMDIEAKMESGEWKRMSTAQIQSAMESSSDSTRTARQKDRDDPQSGENRAYEEIDIVWVQRHIHRDRHDQDWEFYTLSDVAMLTPARKLKDVVFHGKRPYVMGTFIVEAHKAFASGVPQLGKGLQDEANEIVNQRLDNVKFAMNKRWFAKRGKDVDVGALVRNVAGSVTMMDDPTNDVREITTQDVTASAYEEQNRVNLDFDELTGNFNPASLIANGGGQAPARNMALLNQSNGTLVEYGIRAFVETFIQPCLRQMVLLEQEYETDRVILSLAGKNAQLFQRFGIDEVTDEMLMQELSLEVNVGMGATDPAQKLQKFLTGMTSYSNILKTAPPGLNPVEVGKEIFAHLGYRDPTRFFTTDNPQVVQLQEQLQAMGAQLAEANKKLTDKETQQVVGLQKTRETNETKKQVATIQENAANTRAVAIHMRTLLSEHNAREHEQSRPQRPASRA
jgi:hypothetical protein